MFVVTGASGFIGSNMISYLNRLGIKDIIALDDFEIDQRLGYATRANYTNLQDCRFSKVHPISTDEREILPAGDIGGVFHFGAVSNTLEKDQEKIDYYNTRYTEVLGKVCRERGIPLVFASTAAVYGNGNGPLNLYAESKLKGEESIKNSAVCMRLFNVYGKKEAHKGRMASVVYKWFNELSSEGRIRIFENSHLYKRDFVYVGDVCAAAWSAVENYKPGVYDFGSGTSLSFEEVADLVIEAFGAGEREYIPMPYDLAPQYQTNTVADLSPMRELGFGVDPLHPREGISLYMKHLMKMEKAYG